MHSVYDHSVADKLRGIDQMVLSTHLYCNQCGAANQAFKREAHLLAGLSHPNLPQIYDQFPEGGHWYLVMDFIEGETLEDHLHKAAGGYLPVEEVLRIGIELCTVLDYLHTRQPPI